MPAARSSRESNLSWRLGVQGKCVHGASKFRSQRRINHAMALDPALPFEGFGHNIDPEMRFAAAPVAGMAFMQM